MSLSEIKKSLSFFLAVRSGGYLTSPSLLLLPKVAVFFVLNVLIFQTISVNVSAANLDITDGVVVRFGAESQLLVRDNLSLGQGVILTSEQDNTAGGDLGAVGIVSNRNQARHTAAAISKGALIHLPLNESSANQPAMDASNNKGNGTYYAYPLSAPNQMMAQSLGNGMKGVRLIGGDKGTITVPAPSGKVFEAYGVSVELWVKAQVNSWPSNATYLEFGALADGYGYNDNNEWSANFGVENQGQIHTLDWGKDGRYNDHDRVLQSVLKEGNVYHLVWQIENSGKQWVYINGIRYDLGSIRTNRGKLKAFTIGSWSTARDSGSIVANFSWYNRLLTAAEIQDNYRIGSDVGISATDPSNADPIPGYWRGVRLEKSAGVSTAALSGTILRYAGSNNDAAMTIRGFSPQLSQLSFEKNLTGLRVLEGAAPKLDKSYFSGNDTGIEASGAGLMQITNSQLSGNHKYAVNNVTPEIIIQATGNWWGHNSGPKDASVNPQGLGDVVSAGVNFGNYLTTAPLFNPTVRLVTPATYFDQHTVLLDIACVNATEFRIAEGSAFTGVPFQSLIDGRAQVSFVTSDGDGLKNINVQFRNAAGTVTTASLVGGAQIDVNAPTIVVANPAAGSVVSDPISLEASVTDGSGVKHVEFYVDGILIGKKTAQPYVVVWDPTTVSEGAHVVKVVAMDGVGRIAEQSQTFTVERSLYTPRVVSKGLPTNNYTASGAYSSTPFSAFNAGSWNSGGFSGWINVDLGATYTISKVSYTPGIQTGSGASSETRVEKILVSSTGDAFTEVYSESVMATSGVQRIVPIPPLVARYVRISVPSSQSWVSLSNIEIAGVPYPLNGTPDTTGPQITEASVSGIGLADGAIFARSSTIKLSASDRSGIARIELLLDGSVIATASGAGSYTVPFNLDNVANGTHTLAVRAIDSLGNVSTSSYAITVAHAAPDAPVFSQPVNGLTTRTANLVVTGSTKAGNMVQLLLNGQPVGSVLSAGNDGRFTGNVTLIPGANQIQATAADQYGTSAVSSAISVTLDITVPASPSNLTAIAQVAGKVRLTWTRSTDPNATGYDIYRAPNSFTSINEAAKINGSPLNVTSFDDMPPQDATWTYRVVAVNNVGTPSLPTGAAQATSDSVAPKARSIVYTALGKTDVATGRIGQGRVNLVVTTSEVLQTTPYLSIVPQGGVPITVELVKNGDTTYAGSFLIDTSTPSGTANALFSARDVVGNRGTDIEAGATLKIDTEGPGILGIVLNPTTPIKNDTAQTIQATFSFSKAPALTPQIKYLLSGPVRSPVVINGLTQVNATTYKASFTLLADAGLGSPETFSFSFQAQDDLDNISTKVSAFNRFQVYQGNLPPLSVPFAFAAKAQPGGKIKLSWQAVEDASSYQLYRQAPGQAELQVLTRANGIEYIDQTPQDGAYKYAIASVRQSNGQESVSGQSATVDVIASATAPGAPQNLVLHLTGQGLYASWQPPLSSNVDYYNLYRANGTRITSIEGLTPLKTRIKTPQTYDTNPSPTQGAYVVTSVDAAGNESAISNSAYLNASLLPVRDLKVAQIDNNLPMISWTAPNGNVAGYLVYVGPDASKIKLTTSPIASTNLTDTGYTSGERRYTVATVDANGVEMPRSIVMPSVVTQITAGLPIKRGVMNRLQVQVTNTSSNALEGVRVVVRLPINQSATQFKDHKSEVISLAANQTRLIPVIVGGYADLPGAPQAQVGVEITPGEGELIKLARTQIVDVTEGAIVVGMATEEFTRGATGKLKLTIENTSEVDIELLTATNNSTGDSSELRFKILDADNNVLSTQPYKQVVGANVVTLTNGQTVARIPAGANYVSDVFNLNVPGSSPNNIRVKLEVDKLRYHSGQEDEVQIAGRGTEKTVSLLDTTYVGEVTDVNPLSSFGDQDVVITGRALDRASKNPMPNTRLKLVLNQQGFERTFSVLTDASGSFVYTFKPMLTDAGLYKVSAVHPDITDRPEQKAFTINRVTVGPTPYKLDVPKNYPFTIPFTVKAGPGTAATNLHLVLDAASQSNGQLPAGINVQLPAAVSLSERQTLNIPVVFTANNDAQPSGSLILNVVSDEHAGTPLGQVKVNYTLSEAKPYLISTPSFVETGMSQGGNQVETVTVQNKGLQDALNLQFSLVKPDGTPAPSWASIASQSNGTLGVGITRSIDLAFTPPAGTPEGVYEFKLNVMGDNVPGQALNVYVSLTQSGQGNILFKAADIYTATVGKDGKLIPGLVNASITMQNEDVLTVTRELVTDALGEALFQNLPAGNYKFRAKAANHQEVGGRVIVKPGITANQPVFLDYNLVTVEWSVREITIQDRYEITLNATFETDVPAAVVMMQPTSINLPKMNVGDVYYGELTLTNFGLVRADNVKQQLPKSDGMFRYEFLVDIPSALEAKQRVTIPYRVIALQSLEGAASNANASGGGCYSYSNTMSVSCNYQCANGSQSTCGASTSWFSASNSSCTTSGSGGTSGGSGSWGGIGGGGYGGSSTSTPIKMKGQKCAYVPRGDGTGSCSAN